MKITELLAGAAITAGVIAGGMGASTVVASAEPPPPAPVPAPPAGPNPGSPPAWAPPKPVDPIWASGEPQVWDEGWQHWGVWLNGAFVPTY